MGFWDLFSQANAEQLDQVKDAASFGLGIAADAAGLAAFLTWMNNQSGSGQSSNSDQGCKTWDEALEKYKEIYGEYP